MATIVSSGLDYIQKNPRAQLSFGQVEHELSHLKIRERVSSFMSVAGTALLVLAVAGIIGGGAFIVGALAAIAGISALYSMAAREAESALRSRQIQWMGRDIPEPEEAKEPLFGPNGFLGMNWFSRSK